MEGYVGLVELAPEILLDIFEFVNPEDLLSLTAVCRKLRNIACWPQLWKQHCEQALVHNWASSYPVNRIASRLQNRNTVKGREFYLNRYTLLRGISYVKQLSSDIHHDDDWSVALKPLQLATSFHLMGLSSKGKVHLWNPLSEDSYRQSHSYHAVCDLRASSCGGAFSIYGYQHLSVNEASNRFYTCSGPIVEEWDLNSFRLISSHRLHHTLSCMKYDLESSNLILGGRDILMQCDMRCPTHDGIVCSSELPGYPLDIVVDGQIQVCGRFPSILSFDSKKPTRTLDHLYSGAQVLTSMLPYAYQNDKLTRSLVACGQYKGRGTLECYKNAERIWVNRYSASKTLVTGLARPMDWSEDLIFAGTADGCIRVFDVSLNGLWYTENECTDGLISSLVCIPHSKSIAFLSEGSIKVLHIGRKIINDETCIEQDKSHKEVSEQDDFMKDAFTRIVDQERWGLNFLGP